MILIGEQSLRRAVAQFRGEPLVGLSQFSHAGVTFLLPLPGSYQEKRWIMVWE